MYGDRSDEESVLKLPEDEYYGSDFALADEAIVATLPNNWHHAFCGHFIRPLKPVSKENFLHQSETYASAGMVDFNDFHLDALTEFKDFSH